MKQRHLAAALMVTATLGQVKAPEVPNVTLLSFTKRQEVQAEEPPHVEIEVWEDELDRASGVQSAGGASPGAAPQVPFVGGAAGQDAADIVIRAHYEAMRRHPAYQPAVFGPPNFIDTLGLR
jgi:hypothetical protein